MPVSKNKTPVFYVIVPIHLYPYDVIVSIGHTDEEIDAILKRKGVKDGRELSEYGQHGRAKYAVWYDYNIALIRLKCLPRSANDYGALMHEILHVVISVLRKVGMRISAGGGSDEAYTYLMSYLVQHIMFKINKYY